MSSRYSEAITVYDRALASCPNYLDFEIAVLRSNVAACHLKLEDWKAAVDSATASLECLERVIPSKAKEKTTTEEDVKNDHDDEKNAKAKAKASRRNATASTRQTTAQCGEKQRQQQREEKEDTVVELPDDNDADDEEAALKKLAEDDTRRADVQRIRIKSLMRRARARMEQDGWANLQGAEEDYKTLHQMEKTLPPRDRRTVQEKLRELPGRINVAREKEMGEMMGKLKDVSSACTFFLLCYAMLAVMLTFL